MKKILLFGLLVVFTLQSCRKYELDGYIDNKDFVGTWYFSNLDTIDCVTQQRAVKQTIIINEEGYYTWDREFINDNCHYNETYKKFWHGRIEVINNEICMELKKPLFGYPDKNQKECLKIDTVYKDNNDNMFFKVYEDYLQYVIKFKKEK
jgi:hypothetical protein